MQISHLPTPHKLLYPCLLGQQGTLFCSQYWLQSFHLQSKPCIRHFLKHFLLFLLFEISCKPANAAANRLFWPGCTQTGFESWIGQFLKDYKIWGNLTITRPCHGCDWASFINSKQGRVLEAKQDFQEYQQNLVQILRLISLNCSRASLTSSFSRVEVAIAHIWSHPLYLDAIMMQ